MLWRERGGGARLLSVSRLLRIVLGFCCICAAIHSLIWVLSGSFFSNRVGGGISVSSFAPLPSSTYCVWLVFSRIYVWFGMLWAFEHFWAFSVCVWVGLEGTLWRAPFSILAIRCIVMVQAICGGPLKCPTPDAVWNGILRSICERWSEVFKYRWKISGKYW